MSDGVVCRSYKPRSFQRSVVVPLLPASLHNSALNHSHDIPTAGHQGTAKTLHRLQEVAYWVGMAQAVSQYCTQCIVCQQAKTTYSHTSPIDQCTNWSKC